jgi:hypothetical protein
VEREIGNVVADVGLRAFRYLSFPPVVFETRPRPVVEVSVAPAEVPAPAAPPAAPVPMAQPAAVVQAAPPAPAMPSAPPPPSAPVRFADGLPRFGVTALPAGAAAPPSGSIAGGGLFAPHPAAPSFTAPPPSSPAPAFVMPSARAESTPGPSPGPALPWPAMSAPPAAQAAMAPVTAQSPVLPAAAWPDPFAPAALPEAPRLRRLTELQGLAQPPPPRPSGRSSGTRSYALLQDVHAELAGRAPPARREPEA